VKLFNSTNKIVLIIEYNGKRYFGFQWQPGVPTIQDEFEKAIVKLTGENRRVISASRTDTGVHANEQVISFRTESRLPDETFVKALNHYLPNDIAVKAAGRVDENFDIRVNALSREYEYQILNSSIRSPLLEDFTYLVHGKLNIEVMNEACQQLIGEHDFASFASSLRKREKTRRTVINAHFTRENNLIIFDIMANSFLTHQVRNTVGLLLKIGSGKVKFEEIYKIMDSRRPGLAGPAAPACGLCLTKINYPRDVELKYENLFDQSKRY
jgi:tRNA pseudouridine38-40 synthase